MRKSDILPTVAISLSMCSLGIGLGKAIIKSQIENDAKEITTCNAIVVANGEYNRQDNLEITGKHTEKYNVSYINDQSLVVYVYGEDISQRYLYTQFIESNIEIIENDKGEYTVVLNEDNLTDENYVSYVNGLSTNNENNGPQRRRG